MTSPTASVPALTPNRAAFVAVGGAVGATCRWGLFEMAGDVRLEELAWPLLVVNIVGTAVLAWAISESRRRPDRASLLVDGVGTGFCGGLTTFSAFALRTAEQLRGDEVVGAVVTVTSMLAAGLAVTLLLQRMRRS